MVKKLKADEKPIEDETHKVVQMTSEQGEVEHYQYEFGDDPNSKMKKLGISKFEVEKVLEKIAPIIKG